MPNCTVSQSIAQSVILSVSQVPKQTVSQSVAQSVILSARQVCLLSHFVSRSGTKLHSQSVAQLFSVLVVYVAQSVSQNGSLNS